MKKAECLLFKQWDSDTTKEGRMCFHTSFHNAGAPPCPARQSIETRWVIYRGIRNPGVRQCLGFCPADFWSSLAYESDEQKPKHCLTPGFLIPLVIYHLSQKYLSRFMFLAGVWSFSRIIGQTPVQPSTRGSTGTTPSWTTWMMNEGWPLWIDPIIQWANKLRLFSVRWRQVWFIDQTKVYVNSKNSWCKFIHSWSKPSIVSYLYRL